MIGTNTAIADDPALNTRLWPGNDPVRIVIDLALRLPHTLKIFDGNGQTIVFNPVKNEEKSNIRFIKIQADDEPIKQIMAHLYDLQIISLLVEGGSKLLQTFINEGYWNEARVFTNTSLFSGQGIIAPVLQKPTLSHKEQIDNDLLQYFYNR
jgi:diaminohydroxyphosphoribosylaminopyrimidine deaminase/5-amino-6-(5-phosphoribosylamino)uracil reductase